MPTPDGGKIPVARPVAPAAAPAEPAAASEPAADPSPAEEPAAARPRKLLRVRTGFYLHWPPELKNPDSSDGSGRGGPGYVVDLGLPFEKDWCAGQMHKLEAIHPRDQEGVEPSSITACPAAVRLRAAALNAEPEPEPPVTVGEAKERTAAAGAGTTADGVMIPEE